MVHKTMRRNVYRVLVEKPEGKNHFKDLGLGGRITLNCILKEMGLECVDMWAKVGTSGVSLVNAVMNL